VDTTGLLLIVLVATGAVQDRDAARALLWTLRTCFTRVVRSGLTPDTPTSSSTGPPTRSA
jgi:hypothetical protein